MGRKRIWPFAAGAVLLVPLGFVLYRYTDSPALTALTVILAGITLFLLIKRWHDRRRKAFDALTGLPTQQTFCARAATILHQHSDSRYGIVRMDIDRFQVLNSLYDSKTGDGVLRSLGQAMRERQLRLPADSLFGHLGADHFALFTRLEQIQGHEADLCQWFQDSLRAAMPDYTFTCSLGFCAVDTEDTDIPQCCEQALAALRSVKENYDTPWAWFDAKMAAQTAEEQEITAFLHTALEEQQFIPYFQPQYNYVTNTISGTEALSRWLHPEKGLISPALFVPILEKNGLIYEMDKSIWRQVCAYIRKWKDEGLNVPPVSVNISRRDIFHRDLADTLRQIVDEAGLRPRDLHLEITESAYMENPEQLAATMKQLGRMGFFLEMDDFGSGYSSLTVLKDMPFDLIKLDMAFLRQSDQTGKAGSVLTSVVRLAHQINIPVIAEGVEEERQADFLKSVGCYYMQGYLFSRPLHAADYEVLLRRDGKLIDEHKDAHLQDGAADFLDVRTQEAMLFNSFVGGAYILELSGDHVEILRTNDQFFTEVGISREIWADLGAYPEKALTEETYPVFRRMLQQAIDTDSVAECDVCSTRLRPNESLWLHIRARCLTRKVDSYIFYCDNENITERRQLSSRNTELNTDLMAVIDNLPGGVARYRFHGKRLICEFMSDGYHDMRGFTEAELMNIQNIDLSGGVHPDDADAVVQAVEDSRLHRDDFTIRYRVRCKNGSYMWVITNGAYVFHPQGSFIYAYCADITEERAQQAQLAQSRTELDNLLEVVEGGTILFTAEAGRLKPLKVSPGAAGLFGYTPGEFIPAFLRDPLLNVYPEDRAAVAEAQTAAQKPGATLDVTYRIAGRSGRLVWVNFHSRTSDDREQPLIYAAYLCGADAEGRSSGTAARRAHTRHTSDDDAMLLALGQIYLLTAICDPGQDTYRTLGYDGSCDRPEGEIGSYDQLTARLAALVPEGEERRDFEICFSRQALLQAWAQDSHSVSLEHRQTTADGGTIWVETTVWRLPCPEEYGFRHMLTVQDIHSRRKREDMLRRRLDSAARQMNVSEQETVIANSLSQMGRLICRYDIEAGTLLSPKAYAARHGLPELMDEFPMHGSLLTRHAADDETVEAYNDFFAAILAGDLSGSMEGRYVLADGSVVWERSEFVSVFDAHGRPARAVISVEDTTARHSEARTQARATAESESGKLLLGGLIHAGMWTADFDDTGAFTAMQCSPELIRLLDGLRASADTPEALAELVHPEDKAILASLLAPLGDPSAADDFRSELRMKASDGEYRRFVAAGHLTRRADGSPELYVGFFVDVTEERARQAELDSIRTRYRDTLAIARMGTWYFEREVGHASRLYMDDSMNQIFDFRLDVDPESCFAQWYERLHPDSKQEVLDNFRRISQGEALEGIYLWNHPTKGYIYVRYGGYQDSGYTREGYRIYGYQQIVNEIVLREKKLTLELQQALDNYKQADYDKRRDFLTGLYNRLDMFELLKDTLSGRRQQISAVYMMDIDSYKAFNDRYGHVEGDDCLRKIGEALAAYGEANNMRFYRYGGEEILGVSFGSTDQAAGIAADLVALVSGLGIPRDDTPEGVVTVSVGYTTDNSRYEKMIDKADVAMYRAKTAGKNRAAGYEDAE